MTSRFILLSSSIPVCVVVKYVVWLPIHSGACVLLLYSTELRFWAENVRLPSRISVLNYVPLLYASLVFLFQSLNLCWAAGTPPRSTNIASTKSHRAGVISEASTCVRFTPKILIQNAVYGGCNVSIYDSLQRLTFRGDPGDAEERSIKYRSPTRKTLWAAKDTIRHVPRNRNS